MILDIGFMQVYSERQKKLPNLKKLVLEVYKTDISDTMIRFMMYCIPSQIEECELNFQDNPSLSDQYVDFSWFGSIFLSSTKKVTLRNFNGIVHFNKVGIENMVT